jgi:predicted enzyme related to lactoylglutathione lyase
MHRQGEKMTNALNWFEIPASDIARAVEFYGKLLDTQLETMEAMPDFSMAMLPYTPQEGVGGAIIQGEGYAPSIDGSLIYLNGGEDLNTVLSRVEDAGGKIAQPKTGIGENGFVAFFIDSEGNKVGLHSMN